MGTAVRRRAEAVLRTPRLNHRVSPAPPLPQPGSRGSVSPRQRPGSTPRYQRCRTGECRIGAESPGDGDSGALGRQPCRWHHRHRSGPKALNAAGRAVCCSRVHGAAAGALSGTGSVRRGTCWGPPVPGVPGCPPRWGPADGSTGAPWPGPWLEGPCSRGEKH